MQTRKGRAGRAGRQQELFSAPSNSSNASLPGAQMAPFLLAQFLPRFSSSRLPLGVFKMPTAKVAKVRSCYDEQRFGASFEVLRCCTFPRKGGEKRETPKASTYQNGAQGESSHQTCHVPPAERLQSREEKRRQTNKKEWKDWAGGRRIAAVPAVSRD